MSKQDPPPKGKFRVIVEKPVHKILGAIGKDDPHPFPLRTWPLEEQGPPDERPRVEATERMFWRDEPRKHSLAYRAGAMVPEEELPRLIGEKELFGRNIEP